MFQETSMEAYKSALDDGTISRMQMRVLEELLVRPMTGQELDRKTNSTSAHKRVSELVSKGLVEEAGVRACSVSGKNAIEWRVAGPRGCVTASGTRAELCAGVSFR